MFTVTGIEMYMYIKAINILVSKKNSTNHLPRMIVPHTVNILSPGLKEVEVNFSLSMKTSIVLLSEVFRTAKSFTKVFLDFTKFRESNKSLKHELDSLNLNW